MKSRHVWISGEWEVKDGLKVLGSTVAEGEKMRRALRTSQILYGNDSMWEKVTILTKKVDEAAINTSFTAAKFYCELAFEHNAP